MKKLSIFSRPGKPVAWRRPPAQALRGPYAKNNALARLQGLAPVPGTCGPESLAIDRDGLLYSGFDDGRIVCFDRDGRMLREVCNTGGRPLGMRFHPDGSLYTCDTQLGLLKVTLDGQVIPIANSADGTPFGFADDLDISRDGRFVYFTDASSQWHYNEDHLDLIEHGGHGRLIRCDLQTRHTTVLMRGLQFANGVALGPDDEYVLVTETGGYRVHRYWLKGPQRETHEVFIDNLPGFPDNIRFNGRDRFWLAIPAPRNRALDFLAPWPWLRFVVLQYARYFPLPVAHAGIVLAFDLDGRLVANLQDHATGSYHYITQVLEHEQWLYCSSLKARTLARLPLTGSEFSGV